MGHRRESKREQERLGGREWERDPQSKRQSKRRGLTGAKGGWWVRADQGVWDAKTARNSQVVKKQGAVAPLSHRLNTSSRVERPKHDGGCESAAQERQLEASGQGKVGSMRMHGVEQKR